MSEYVTIFDTTLPEARRLLAIAQGGIEDRYVFTHRSFTSLPGQRRGEPLYPHDSRDDQGRPPVTPRFVGEHQGRTLYPPVRERTAVPPSGLSVVDVTPCLFIRETREDP